ncbi:hypothetical protein C2845_PM04G05530 [Panicum miliaceum]|uniref:NB-ARC domain-containing protein n=1 Tax=Panicum miliaceum TaxID=4540 RepID=A0A3L6QRF4_PANMI|nr:hypothetical protein C2845_PM04G05530 [Panicum miliaceum]
MVVDPAPTRKVTDGTARQGDDGLAATATDGKKNGYAALCCCCDSIYVYQNGTKLTIPGSSSNEVIIIGTDDSLVPRDEILEDQHVGTNEEMVRKSLTRTGTIAAALEESLLVGREKEKYDIINLISNQDAHQLTVISVWGMGVMRPFVLEEVVNSLAMQLDAASSYKKGNFEEMAKLLEGKRCLIVLDDLSSIEEWDQLLPKLSKMGNTSQIIVTTREENIAMHCSRKPENTQAQSSRVQGCI